MGLFARDPGEKVALNLWVMLVVFPCPQQLESVVGAGARAASLVECCWG